MRKLYVTVTNIPPTVSNTTRILQSTANLALTFTASAGDASSGASALLYGAFLALASLVMFAF